MGNKCAACFGKSEHKYDHDKIQSKLDKLGGINDSQGPGQRLIQNQINPMGQMIVDNSPAGKTTASSNGQDSFGNNSYRGLSASKQNSAGQTMSMLTKSQKQQENYDNYKEIPRMKSEHKANNLDGYDMFGVSHDYSVMSEPTIDYNDMEGNQYGNLMESFRQSVKTQNNNNGYADIESSYHEAAAEVEQHIKQDVGVMDTQESREGTFKEARMQPFISMNNQSMDYYDYGNNIQGGVNQQMRDQSNSIVSNGINKTSINHIQGDISEEKQRAQTIIPKVLNPVEENFDRNESTDNILSSRQPRESDNILAMRDQPTKLRNSLAMRRESRKSEKSRKSTKIKTYGNYCGTKSMAVLMLNANIGTPEAIRNKIINLEIVLNAPAYDGEGKLLHPEDDESHNSSQDEQDDNLAEYFNAELLEEEVMDKQVYDGSMSSYGSEQENKPEYVPSNIINLPRNEDDIQADFKKHLNLDFDQVDPSDSEEDDDNQSYEGLQDELQENYDEVKGLISTPTKELTDPDNFDSILQRKGSLPGNLRNSFQNHRESMRSNDNDQYFEARQSVQSQDGQFLGGDFRQSVVSNPGDMQNSYLYKESFKQNRQSVMSGGGDLYQDVPDTIEYNSRVGSLISNGQIQSGIYNYSASDPQADLQNIAEENDISGFEDLGRKDEEPQDDNILLNRKSSNDGQALGDGNDSTDNVLKTIMNKAEINQKPQFQENDGIEY